MKEGAGATKRACLSLPRKRDPLLPNRTPVKSQRKGLHPHVQYMVLGEGVSFCVRGAAHDFWLEPHEIWIADP